MNIVNSGNQYQIYGEEVKTTSLLPIQTYLVRCSKQGFFLTSHPELVVNEEHIYGKTMDKIDKVLYTYNSMKNRNLGVLLSGEKGTGKSLFLRLLARKALHTYNLPIIIVDTAYPGLPSFISSITQPCVVIFDEFEKVFQAREHDDWNPQEDMLTLFDGMDGGHKLFLVTCNELNRLNEYMLNRPGRFHYHITVTTPSPSEIREYLREELKSEYYDVIEEIVGFSGVISMPYDHLRAIAFEINQGYSLKETMQDLNIAQTNNIYFDIKAILKDGTIYEGYGKNIDISSHALEYMRLYCYTNGGRSRQLCFEFIPALAQLVNGEYIINTSILKEPVDSSDFYPIEGEEAEKMAEHENNNTIEYIILKRSIEHGLKRLV